MRAQILAVALTLIACSGDREPALETLRCAEGKAACGGVCVDLTTDVENCGKCGATCDADVGCFARKCTSPGSLNVARRDHALALAPDGKIYCIGGAHGFADDLDELASVEVYDPSTNRWTEIAPLKTPRFALNAAVLEGKVYAFGGSEAFNVGPVAPMKTTEVYDPLLGKWQPGPDLVTERGDFAATLGADGRVWAMWGWTKWNSPPSPPTLTEQVETLEAGKSWGNQASDAIDPARGPRFGARAATSQDGMIYLVGGAKSLVVKAETTASVDVFDPSKGIWAAAADLPGARAYGAAAATSDGRIWYAGGIGGANRSADFQVYSPQSKAWTLVAELPVPLAFMAAVTGLDGRIYVAGGFVNDNAPPLDAVFVYDPARDVWYQ